MKSARHELDFAPAGNNENKPPEWKTTAELLKQFDDMTTMMKRMGKLGQKGLMRQGIGALMPGMGGGGGFGGGRRPFR